MSIILGFFTNSSMNISTYVILFFLTIAAKVFPGRLSLEKSFQPGMDDKTSKLFREQADQIERAVRD